MTLNEEEFNRICFFMKNHFGVNLQKKRNLIEGRLENKLTSRGYGSYSAFMDAVEAEPDGEEATLLINTLTTNHTYFMREPVHFEFLRDVALPQIKESAKLTHDIRIWSAAASSGEEAYSIVMILKDFLGFEASAWDSTVLATDISTKVLAIAQNGVYPAEHIASLPTRWIRQHMIKLSDDSYQFKPETRKEIVFHTFNLMDDFPWKKKFHVIFLRNVMIYFDETTKLRLLKKMSDCLESGGYLMIGTTENINTEGLGLEYVQPSIYKKL